MAKPPSIASRNATIAAQNKHALALTTPAQLLFNYHQELFKKMSDGMISNEDFKDSDRDPIITAVLTGLGVNPEVNTTENKENFFDIIKGRRSPIPRTVPTLDGKYITWEQFDDFIEKYAKNPILMQRLGLDSNTDGKSEKPLPAAQVSKRISDKVEPRKPGQNKARKIISNVAETNLISYTTQSVPPELESFFRAEVLNHIITKKIPLQYKTNGTAFGMTLDIVDQFGTVKERHYIKQSFNPAPSEDYSAEKLRIDQISAIPEDIIPFASYQLDETNNWSGRELLLTTDVQVIDPNSLDYINYDIGHTIGDATQRLKRQLQLLIDLHSKETNPDIKDGYAQKIIRHKEFIKQAELLDRSEIQVDGTVGDLTELEVLQIQRELAKTAGTINVLRVSRQKLVDSKPGVLTFDVSSQISITNAPKLNEYMVEFKSFNALKGAKARTIMMAAQRSLLLPRSTSPATLLLHKELAKIFGDQDLLDIANKNVKKVREVRINTKQKIFVPKKVNIKSSKVKEAEIKARRSANKLKVLPSSRRNKSRINSHNSLVSLLNANIREYVIAEMNYPALQNRSGRFASSVKILSVDNQRALESTIRFTYMKSPYMIFSRSRGKSPWNSVRDRDPGTIIDRAIKRLGNRLLNSMIIHTEEY